ncbi:MAG: ribosome-associated translation inhibitor RaiA [Actinobacteria bacterium]|nr:ribosome-associated translation inhibitor RaiA [Actinomycetota bacterium]
MEVVLKGRGFNLSDHVREVADHKLAKLSRIEPRSVRIEVEIIAEKNPRLDGTKRLEASLEIPRHTFRAHAEDPHLENALDTLIDRLERQLRDHHGKQRTTMKHGGSRLKSSLAVEDASEEP